MFAKEKLADLLSRLLIPITGFVTLVCGVAWQLPFDSYKKIYQSWIGLINFVQSYIFPTFLIFAVLNLSLSMILSFLSKGCQELRDELDATNAASNVLSENLDVMVKGMLFSLAGKLGLEQQDESRLTIYVHDGDCGFVPFGRYSPNPDFSKKGRNSIKDSEGCIAKAWRSGWCYEASLSHLQYRNYNLNRAIVNGLKMKSKYFAVKRIDTYLNESLAVIVFESQKENRFMEAEIRKIFDEEHQYFSHVISRIKPYIPELSFAKGKGF